MTVARGIGEALGEVKVGDQPGLTASERRGERLLDLIWRARDIPDAQLVDPAVKELGIDARPDAEVRVGDADAADRARAAQRFTIPIPDRLGTVVAYREVVPTTGFTVVVRVGNPGGIWQDVFGKVFVMVIAPEVVADTVASAQAEAIRGVRRPWVPQKLI